MIKEKHAFFCFYAVFNFEWHFSRALFFCILSTTQSYSLPSLLVVIIIASEARQGAALRLMR